ncbi:MAG: phosphatidylglycerophosphatase A [Calditrichaeota bacterium]|nr:MAG: phosphatidylglycerophosphatase A [Calditrichota bacterium]
MKFFHYVIATGLGFGYSPIAPGTAGSILALVTGYFFLGHHLPLLLIGIVVITLLGIISASYVENTQGKEDPSIVVVDEVAGMWIALIMVPHSPGWYLAAFLLFRFFDVAKPYPIRSMEKFHGGLGIMLDDIIAGVYSLIILQIAVHFLT